MLPPACEGSSGAGVGSGGAGSACPCSCSALGHHSPHHPLPLQGCSELSPVENISTGNHPKGHHTPVSLLE